MARKGPPSGRRCRLQWEHWQPAEEPEGKVEQAGPQIDVGGSLRKLREERNLTLRALAEMSGLAVNTLSLIENGRSSPSVGTLQQVAAALNVPITAFFETEAPECPVAYVKAGRRSRAAFDQGSLEDLGAGAAITCVEPLIVNLAAGAGSGRQAIVHTGIEFVYCLKGRVTYSIDGQTFLLEPGDSLLFEAHLPHKWQNIDLQRSQMIVVLYPSDENDTPTERHFAQA